MKPRNLTPKQAAFVSQYAIDHNGSAAAVRAGFAPRSAHVAASRLLRKDNVRAAVTEGEKEAQAALNVTRQDVLRALQDAIDMAKLQGNPMAMISGWREVAKICGFLAPERKHIEVSTPVKAPDLSRYEAMTDEQLEALIVAGAQA